MYEQLRLGREAHDAHCFVKGGVPPATTEMKFYGTCCEKGVLIKEPTCVCAYVICCPDHGHTCFGSHE